MHKVEKNTSGGVVMFGNHLLHHWSSTQSVVALSSAEAELNAIVKGASEILGIMNLLKECNHNVEGRMWTDSSAAKGILHRQGAGKVKHLECRQLWVQEKIANKIITCSKVPREKNLADALTHHWTTAEGTRHMRNMGVESPHTL